MTENKSFDDEKKEDAFDLKWQDIPSFNVRQFDENISEKQKETKPPEEKPVVAPREEVKPPKPPYYKEVIRPEETVDKEVESEDVFVEEENDKIDFSQEVYTSKKKREGENFFRARNTFSKQDKEKEESISVGLIMFIIFVIIAIFILYYWFSEREERVRYYRYRNMKEHRHLIQEDVKLTTEDFYISMERLWKRG